MSAALVQRIARAARRRSEADAEYRDAIVTGRQSGMTWHALAAAAGCSYSWVRRVYQQWEREQAGTAPGAAWRKGQTTKTNGGTDDE